MKLRLFSLNIRLEMYTDSNTDYHNSFLYKIRRFFRRFVNFDIIYEF